MRSEVRILSPRPLESTIYGCQHWRPYFICGQFVLAVANEGRVEQLERDLAAQPQIVGTINSPHPARAERVEPLRADDFPRGRLGVRVCDQLGSDLERGRLDEVMCLLVGRE